MCRFMCLKNTLQTYGVIAKIFHWLMAVLIIVLLAVGLIMADMENSPDKFKLIAIHKEVGIVVLFLASLRLSWKILDVSPLLPDSLGKMAKLGAKLGHFGLYVLMFAMPITGWLMSSAAGFPVSMFGFFVMPNLIAPDKEFSHDMNELHEILAWILMGLIALHIIAALLHHFYYRDNTLIRMLPNFRGKNNDKNSSVNNSN
ncbi:MAG: cytochrome b [Rickettsiales bacterium]